VAQLCVTLLLAGTYSLAHCLQATASSVGRWVLVLRREDSSVPSLTLSIVLTTLTLGLVGGSLSISLGQTSGPSSANVSFSTDEQSVFIEYQGQQWSFSRPIISPWAYQAADNVYWVATSGDDQNDGTLQAPLASINEAVNRAAAGDIIYVQAGTYVENLYITTSGEPDKPIIISCAPGALGKVTITPSQQFIQTCDPIYSAVINEHAVQYVWINGFIIQGPIGMAWAQEVPGFCGIAWENGAGFGCLATNNVIYRNPHCGLKERGHGGTSILMEGNVIFGNGFSNLDHGIYCPANDCTMNGNIVFNNASWGIHAYSNPQRLQISKNLAVGNGSGGIVLAGDFCSVYNNVSAYNGVYGILYYGDQCADNIVMNNIFTFNQDDGGPYASPGPVRNTDDYNCYFPGKPGDLLPAGPHEIYADPQFVSPATGDFRLKAESPCIGSGTLLGLPGDAISNIGAF
jgi:hypothetical protein